jgi:hypothetical protein
VHRLLARIGRRYSPVEFVRSLRYLGPYSLELAAHRVLAVGLR